MRKFSVLLAAALMVSVPLSMTVMTTDVYAAAKEAKKAKKAKKAAKAAPAAPKETGVQPPFQSMYNAVNDLGNQLVSGGKK